MRRWGWRPGATPSHAGTSADRRDTVVSSRRLSCARYGVVASALLPVAIALRLALETPEAVLDLDEGDGPGIPGRRLVQILGDRELDATQPGPADAFLLHGMPPMRRSALTVAQAPMKEPMAPKTMPSGVSQRSMRSLSRSAMSLCCSATNFRFSSI